MAELFRIAVPMLTAAWLWLRHRRRQGWGESKLLFEGVPAAITNLGLDDLTAIHPKTAPSP